MKKFSVIIVLVLTAALIFTGCGNASQTASESASESVSASEAASVSPSEAASPSLEEVLIQVAGSTSVGPVIEALAEKYMEAHPNVSINVEQTGSGAGVTACGDGTANMGMASRDLKDDEKTLYPDMQTHLLCLDGLAIVVSKDNPVTELTAEQVKKIFLGEITDWSDVGGTAGEIILYSRDSVSGTREAFQNLFLGKNEAGEQIEIEDAMCQIVDSNGAMGTQVEANPMGIGYMSLGLVSEHNLTALTIDGVAATTDNLMAGTYKYFRNFNLLTMGDPTGELKSFMDYCMADAEATDYMVSKGYLLP